MAQHYELHGLKFETAQALVATRRLGKGQLVLGQRADGNGGITKAVYDQVRVWDRPLSHKGDQYLVQLEGEAILSARPGCREFDGARTACGDGPTARSLRSSEAQPQATSSLAPFFEQ